MPRDLEFFFLYQHSGRFPDSQIITQSRLPKYYKTVLSGCSVFSVTARSRMALYSLLTVTRSHRFCTCFPFNRPIFNMKTILYSMYCSISRIKTAGTNYLLYETFNILAYPLPIYNNHFSLANHSKYGILIRYLQKHIWRRIEVVITGRTRNALALRGTRVRIPPSPLFQKETQFALYSCFLFLFTLFRYFS